MNLNSKEYVPKQSPSNQSNIQFNMNATEYVPKKQFQNQNQFQQQNYYGGYPQYQQYNQGNYMNNQYTQNYNQGQGQQFKEDFEKMKISSEGEGKKVGGYKGVEEYGEESDEESWYPKYKDCECCKGFVYKCKGEACSHLRFCVCKIQEECDL